MQRYYILVKFLLPVFILGCSSNSDKENNVLREMIIGLETSNSSIDKSSYTFLKDLEGKLYDPATSEKAKIWNTRAQEICKLSSEIYNYIREIKNGLKNASTKKGEDSEKSFDGTNKTAVIKTLFTDKRGEELVSKLKNHRESLFKIDSNIRSVFQASYFSPTEQDADYFFKGSTVLEALAVLTQMQNSIKINENWMVAFCHNKVPNYFDGWYDYYSAIIGQSSSVVKPGEKIQITAGVGAFSSKAMPEIIIDGSKVPIDETGVGNYHFKSSTINGKHFKKVKISYRDQYGKKQIIEQVVEYIVSDCKN